MMTKVTDQLYISDWYDAQLLKTANPETITAVLNVCEQEDGLAAMHWMKYLHVPFPDGQPIPRERFDKCMNWLSDRYKTKGRILIHCDTGLSRSATLCAAFLAHAKVVSGIADGYTLVKKACIQASPSILLYSSAAVYVSKTTTHNIWEK